MKPKSIKKNSIYNLIKNFSSMLFPLITFPYVTRVLLPENMGKYNFGITYVNYFLLIAGLGVSTYAVRECSIKRNDREKLNYTASNIFSINMCSTILSYILFFTSLLLFRKLSPYANVMVIYSCTIIFVTLGVDWLNSAMEDFKYITIRTVAFNLFSVIAVFILVKKPEDYIKYAVITAISASGSSLVNIFYRRKFCTIHFTTHIEWKKHFPPIITLFATLVSQTIFNSLDITIIGLTRSDYEVGLYSTSVKIYDILARSIPSILWVVLPRMSLLFTEQKYTEINILLEKIFGFFILLGLPCIVGIGVLAEEFLEILGGIEYSRASVSTRILMVAFLFSLAGEKFIGNIILIPSKKEKYFLLACITAAVTNLVLNIILIPLYGINAAALTTAISHLVMLCILMKFANKNINISLLPLIRAPIVGCIVIILLKLLIDHFITELWTKVLLTVFFSVVLYFITLLLMNDKTFLLLWKQITGHKSTNQRLP